MEIINFLVGLESIHLKINFRNNIKCYNLAIFDILGFGLSSLALMILAKTRLVMTTDCCSMSYNDHNIDVHKLPRNDDEKEIDDTKYDDLPSDSFKRKWLKC